MAIVATIPVIFYGALELRLWMRRRRQEAVARRRKGPGGRPAKRG
jgi:hypothetical protein